MLKELEEPGKERVRHLNHRKEKDPPHDSQPRGRNNMQSNHKTKTHSQVSSMKNRASKNKKGCTLEVIQSHVLLQLNAKNILQQLLSWRKDSSCSQLRQTKPSLEDSDSPFPSFQGIKILQAALKILVVGGVHPADYTAEQNYPNKPHYREWKPFQQGKPGPHLLPFPRSSDERG